MNIPYMGTLRPKRCNRGSSGVSGAEEVVEICRSWNFFITLFGPLPSFPDELHWVSPPMPPVPRYANCL